MAHWGKDLALSLLWSRFHPWAGTYAKQMHKQKKKKKKKKMKARRKQLAAPQELSVVAELQAFCTWVGVDLFFRWSCLLVLRWSQGLCGCFLPPTDPTGLFCYWPHFWSLCSSKLSEVYFIFNLFLFFIFIYFCLFRAAPAA